MADQGEQQRQQPPAVHFRWIGSNAPVASLLVNDRLFDSRDPHFLQKALAPKLGLLPERWYQVTLYWSAQRLTPDVLLGFERRYMSIVQRYHYVRRLMPQTTTAWHSFVAQLHDASKDIVVEVTRCSDADVEAAASITKSCYWRRFDSWRSAQQDAGAKNLWKKYSNNVAFMINVVTAWNYGVYENASTKMQQNELFALAALDKHWINAKVVSQELWNKPSFVVKAAANHKDCYFGCYLGPNVLGDSETMLFLIRLSKSYFYVAAAKNDFDFQCLAVSANPEVLTQLNGLAAKKVAQAMPENSNVQKVFRNLTSQYLGLLKH